MRRMQYAAAAAAAWALLATPSHAQRRPAARPPTARPPAAAAATTPGVIRVGQTVTGTLTTRDPRTKEKGRFRVYRFDARKGQRLIATLRSSAFDAFLTIARSVSGITDPIATDDDRGGGEKNTDARVRFTAPDDGTYLMVAQSLSEEGVGAYTLNLAAAPAAVTSTPRPIAVGQTVSGRLDETDAVLEDDDTFYDTWLLNGRKGQRVMIEMKADSLDSFLSVGRMEGTEFNSIRTDDDGGQGNNSRMTLVLPDDGQYVIRANEVGTKTGAYTLSVTERQPGPATATPHPIEPNQEVTGTLSDEDPAGDDDSYYDYWTYQGHAGEHLRITMSSEAFDTFVAIGTVDGNSYNELASNDDGPDGTNSLLEFTLPNDGTFVIRAKALSGESTGAYKLKVEKL
jgi:hypothetical protein